MARDCAIPVCLLVSLEKKVKQITLYLAYFSTVRRLLLARANSLGGYSDAVITLKTVFFYFFLIIEVKSIFKLSVKIGHFQDGTSIYFLIF